MNEHEAQLNENDPRIAEISRSLDALARADREAAPAGLEARVAAASGAMLERSAPAPLTFPRTTSASGGVSRMGLRLAAMVAVAATIGAVQLARHGTGSGGASPVSPTPVVANADGTAPVVAQATSTDTISAEEEALYALAGWDDEGTQDLAELRLAADELKESLSNPWTQSGLLTEQGALR